MRCLLTPHWLLTWILHHVIVRYLLISELVVNVVFALCHCEMSVDTTLVVDMDLAPCHCEISVDIRIGCQHGFCTMSL